MMKFLESSTNRIIIICALALLMGIVQYPFLNADPEINISTSRGANTDEGLYSCQIRNYINHGDLCLDKTDGLIKTPLLSVVLYPSLEVFGISKQIARITVLLVFLLLFYHVFYQSIQRTLWAIIATAILLFQFYVFHFSHFCLAEILSSVCLCLAVIYSIPQEKQAGVSNIFLSNLFCALAYYFKIQFIYVLPLVPLIHFVQWIFNVNRTKQQFRLLIYSICYSLAFLFLYVICWYLPNRQLLDFVMTDQTSERWVHWSDILSRIKYVLSKYFHNDYLIFFSLGFYISLALGFVRLLNKPNKFFSYAFIGLLCWLLLESHKFLISYLPTRYIISILFAMGLLISLVIAEYLGMKKNNSLRISLKSILILVTLMILVTNVFQYFDSLGRRTFEMAKVEALISKESFGQAERHKPIIGPWAPSLSWQSDFLTLPVWKGYFNDQDPFVRLDPLMIVSEIDEEDSNQAYSSQQIYIDDKADSIHYFKVNRWDLKLLYIQKEK